MAHVVPPQRDSVRGPPALDAGVAGDPAVARACEVQAHARQLNVQKYAERLLQEAARPTVRVGTDGVKEILIADAARATVDEVEKAIPCVMPERAAFATALNRRSARACGLQPDESYRIVTEDGKIMAQVLRNVIPAELAAAWPDVEQHHERHADMWALGCEADPDPNIERTVAALKHAKGAAGFRIQKGMTVHAIEPRSGVIGNKFAVTYTNNEGRKVEGFGVGGCPIERHHHTPRQLDELHSNARSRALLQSLHSVYAMHVVPFLQQAQFPSEVRASSPSPHLSTSHSTPCSAVPVTTLHGYPRAPQGWKHFQHKHARTHLQHMHKCKSFFLSLPLIAFRAGHPGDGYSGTLRVHYPQDQ
jgi:hypothetical protein